MLYLARYYFSSVRFGYSLRSLALSFAQWRYSNQWSNREVLLLLVENYTQYPALLVWNTASWSNFWGLPRELFWPGWYPGIDRNYQEVRIPIGIGAKMATFVSYYLFLCHLNVYVAAWSFVLVIGHWPWFWILSLSWWGTEDSGGFAFILSMSDVGRRGVLFGQTWFFYSGPMNLSL